MNKNAPAACIQTEEARLHTDNMSDITDKTCHL